MPYKFPLSSSPIDSKSLAAILDSYQDRPAMKIVDDFEEKIREYTGSKYVLALNSGTAAIHLALKALGVGPGDCVMAPTFTYVATINPILYLGAYPVLIDSEATTWNMDPELLEEAIKDKLKEKINPRCVIVVHSYGMPARMDELGEVCARYDIPILEDAAEAIGSRYKNSIAGTLGEVGIFSFNNNKILTTYGGGAIITNNEEIFKKSLFWSTQSRENKPFYEHTDIGFNYRMGPLNAAAGLVGIENLKSKIDARRQQFQSYRELFKREGIDAVWQNEGQEYFSNRWLSTPLLTHLNVSDIIAKSEAIGIECRRVWNPMHLQPYYKEYQAFNNGVSEQLFAMGICLPSARFEDILGPIKALFSMHN